jgi:MFS family permease
VSFLSKDRIVAPADYNRWLVPPAALAIHLSIGMAYGFSVFWLPLSKSGPGDWKVSTLGWMYTLFFVFLGSSAALFGAWLEREGPRKAGLLAALCWGGGFFVSALGVYVHDIWLLWLGSGVIGGCGLGLGYISPVSTLIKWFPDRRGMATGLAIMGFGGGAMIGTPLADTLLRFYATETSPGVWQTFLTLGTLYLVAMTLGALSYRLPPAGWRPAGYVPPPTATTASVRVGRAVATPQFWLLWAVLCLNVSAGIGVLGMASPMIQEVFAGRVGPSEAAGFTGLLSLFNIAGRIGWASLSDWLGRPVTYGIFFALGAVLYVLVPFAGRAGSIPLFVGLLCAIVTMYGGGFAAIPAYLADRFGVAHVSAIHGRLLTAWSTAGVVGPVLVNYLREWQLEAGVSASAVYDRTLWMLGGLLVLGFLCNLAVRPVPEPLFEQLDAPASSDGARVLSTTPARASWGWVALAWLAVGIPLLWGTSRTLLLVSQLF